MVPKKRLAPQVGSFVLSLGSNVEPRVATLTRAVAGLSEHGCVVAVAPLFESPFLGAISAQLPVLNTVVFLASHFDPETLMQRLLALESSLGRHRFGQARQIDIDMVCASRPVRESLGGLVLPHPRAHERAFVLAPWLCLDPDATLYCADVGGNRRVEHLLRRALSSGQTIQAFSLPATADVETRTFCARGVRQSAAHVLSIRN